MKKRCGKCLRYKFFNEYCKDKHTSSGLQSYCKQCKNEWRTGMPYIPKVRVISGIYEYANMYEYHKKYRQINKEKWIAYRKKWYIKKMQGHIYQRRRGKIIPPSKEGMRVCTICYEEKTLDEFFISRIEPLKLEHQCKICRMKIMMELYWNTTVYRKYISPTLNTQKICSMCKEIKNIDEFYLSSLWADEHQYQCKECRSEYQHKKRFKGTKKGFPKKHYTCSVCYSEFTKENIVKLFNDDIVCLSCTSFDLEESLEKIIGKPVLV
jgi:hypothetical protein